MPLLTPQSPIASCARWYIEILDDFDLPALQELLELSTDYFELITGLPPGPSEAHSMFLAIPEGVAYENKILAGVRNQEHGLIGVLDAIKDFRAPGEWQLGLLLLAPDQRGQGLGCEVYSAFEKWAQTEGAQVITIGVAIQNECATSFWRKLGFIKTGKQNTFRVGNRDTTFDMFERRTAS